MSPQGKTNFSRTVTISQSKQELPLQE